MNYHLRPATPADRAFLWQLHAAALRPHIEAARGWDEAYERARFEGECNSDLVQILVAGDQDIGVCVVWELPEQWHLALLEVLPAWQGRGIGAAVMRDLFRRADAAGKPVTLRVLKVNDRARQLYKRLGLCVVNRTAQHYLMQRPVGAAEQEHKELAGMNGDERNQTKTPRQNAKAPRHQAKPKT